MPDLSLESSLGHPVCGIDEAGRGPWAGPVVAAACLIDPTRADPELCGRIDDSKKLAKTAREALCADLTSFGAEGFWFGVGEASVSEIDDRNILQATMLAMQRAFAALRDACGAADAPAPQSALIDGNKAPGLPVPARTVVKGDASCLSIAAASVVAKARRDEIMQRLAVEHPGYGWERNAGYGTAEHQAALARLGVTPHHRTSFKPIAALVIGGGRETASA